jgi:predicted nucleotidyltransferase
VKATVTHTPSLDEIKAAVRSICETRPEIDRVSLFGSVARGEARAGSDVDLLIEFMPGSRIGLFEMGSLKEDLEESLACTVDLVSRPAVERSRNLIRRAAILAQLILVYAR